MSEDAPQSEEQAADVEMADKETFKLRSYQDEMLEESLKRNTIVVLNTGAGKTHIAVARMRAELETGEQEKLVWFLAPTVALCQQHHGSLKTTLPAYQIRVLTSEDDVDRWTDQETWNGVLRNMRIVISTYGVLYDALSHGFVKIQNLSLCVFDEAHHCTKKHPSNMIMHQFYRPAKLAGQSVPVILGLSASPVMKEKAGGLEVLEANLDSHAITPRLHRSELMQFVHVPELTRRVYFNLGPFEMPTKLGALQSIINKYNIRNDPYVVEILKEDTESRQMDVEKVLTSRKTYCTEQLTALRIRAETIAKNVSMAASDTYIQACCDKFLTGVQQSSASWMPELSDKEKSHLAMILTGLQHKQEVGPSDVTSPKTRLLLDVLREEAGDSFTGIIFVEQRAVVTALAEYLTSLPEFKDLFNIGTFVGGSSSSKKKANIGDINDVKGQQLTLDDFRIGKKNLIIATSVLEEGIDVSSCQTVICFDAPLNMVSFVQRRGRARKRDSKYIILLADDDKKGEPTRWHDLEIKMKTAYEDEYRNAQLAAEIESIDEYDGRKYQVHSTGALLTLDNAKSHLYHFCATLQTSNYVDLRPTFVCHTDPANLITAEVVLPTCIHQKYRKSMSAHTWRTERAAMKDAAYQACVALHIGGLLNDHLLPLAVVTPDQAKQERPGLIQVAKRINPWSTSPSSLWYEHALEVEIDGNATATVLMLLPIQCPQIPDIRLYWSPSVEGTASIRFNRSHVLDADSFVEARRKTRVLLCSVFPSLPEDDKFTRYAALFETLPGEPNDHFSGQSFAAEAFLSKVTKRSDIGLVRVKGQSGRAFLLENTMTEGSQPGLLLDVVNFSRNRDLLNVPNQVSRRNRQTRLELVASECLVDALPARYSFLAASIPSILHQVENVIIAHDLQHTLLQPIGIDNLQLIIQATTSSSADPISNYERVEYLGDAVLKFFTHVQLMAQHPEWPESYLTAEKGRTNGNASLSRAALRSGVDKYISTKRFTANHWKPPLSSDVSKKDDDEETVERSTKTLADVIEALIGASFIDKGLEGATTCIKIFLPKEQWYGLPDCHRILLQAVPASDTKCSSTMDLLQKLVGYNFQRPVLLLEAITHASYGGNETLSYERLEFLGDAILDQIIIPEMYTHASALKNHQMHDLRQALANSHILGFCCMELYIEQERFDPVAEAGSHTPTITTLVKNIKPLHLYDFLRCGAQIYTANTPTLLRHQKLRRRILEALEEGTEYPWPDLLALHPPKWFSDLIESILGAIYIDSGGSLDACRGFVERCGILRLMRRFLDGGVGVGFPKVRLGVLADKEEIEYDTRIMEVDADSAGVGNWGCRIRVGGEEVVEVRGCCSREEAEVRGAVEACWALEGRKDGKKRKVEVDEDEDEVMIDVE